MYAYFKKISFKIMHRTCQQVTHNAQIKLTSKQLSEQTSKQQENEQAINANNHTNILKLISGDQPSFIYLLALEKVFAKRIRQSLLLRLKTKNFLPTENNSLART